MADFSSEQLKYLHLLSKQFPSIQAASTEIINLNAILNLAKGTEHFLSDIHGEYEAFLHVVKSSSGFIKRKIDELLADMITEEERQTLATLIYYPEQKVPHLIDQVGDKKEEWYRLTLFRLIRLSRVMSSKYTRSKVRKALPRDFAYIIEELLHEQENVQNKQAYYLSIIDTIIETGRARAFIIALANLIQRLAVDHLHIIGDVYDRGPGAHLIMDHILQHHSVDFQWGNHDILWMGAAAGGDASLANVIRISLRYANMDTLETGYGIRMLPLASFAMEVYGNDPCDLFMPKNNTDEEFTENERHLMAQMHKAIAVIQFKVEGQIIQRRPQYNMSDRLLLDKINFEAGTVRIGDTDYKLLDTNFPTIDPANPYALSEQEAWVLEHLRFSFMHSEKLQAHVRFLYANGSMYLRYNGNLLYHGCIPLTEEGEFYPFTVAGQRVGVRAYMDYIERQVRRAYFAADSDTRLEGLDAVWYLWTGPNSPLFGKSKMATFERYFVAEKETHTELRNPYYNYRDDIDFVHKIIREFDLDPQQAHIINGHVPVKVKKGESPIKADGRLLVIDGGLSKAYQAQTGIAGYTLIYNSYGLLLASHKPFESLNQAIYNDVDLHSRTQILERNLTRLRVRDTDLGQKLERQIEELKLLLAAYRGGQIKAKPTR